MSNAARSLSDWLGRVKPTAPDDRLAFPSGPAADVVRGLPWVLCEQTQPPCYFDPILGGTRVLTKTRGSPTMAELCSRFELEPLVARDARHFEVLSQEVRSRKEAAYERSADGAAGLSRAILALAQSWCSGGSEEAEDPTLLWAGHCGDFADGMQGLCDRLGICYSVQDIGGNFEDWELDAPFPAPAGLPQEEFLRLGLCNYVDHVWIAHRGRHYDARMPEGVDCPLELPVVRGAIAEGLHLLDPALLTRLAQQHVWWAESIEVSQALSDHREQLQARRGERMRSA